jgi:hypothetical protein
MSLEMAHKVILPPKKNYIPQFLKQRDINSYYPPPPSPPGECVPLAFSLRGGGPTLAGWRGGRGVNILEDARHSSVLYLYRILFGWKGHDWSFIFSLFIYVLYSISIWKNCGLLTILGCDKICFLEKFCL